MSTETPQAEPSPVNGGEPTDQEALLASQVDTIGENPTEEPVPAPKAGEAPVAAAPAPAAAADPAAAPAPDADAQAAKPATDVTAAAPAPADVPAPQAAPVQPKPEAPRDFDSAFAENQRKFDDGEIDSADYQKELRTISREEAAFSARVEIWQERQQTAIETAAQSFNVAALGWEAAHKDFMSNPLRAQQMQAALAAVDARTPGLSPAALFAEAEKVAFEAFNWQPKTPAPVDTAAIAQAAIDARKPAGVPQTLSSAAAAAPIEAPAGNSTFDALDSKDISSLEDAVARMSREQQEAYLRAAPGSSSPATNRQTGAA